jgi:hypothetical protein
VKKKIWGNLQKIIELSTQKIVIRLSKIYGWDPGSRKTYSGSRIQGLKRHQIPDPGVKKAPAPGSGSATLHIRFVEISTTHIP